MGILRVSIFQKELAKPLGVTTLKRLASLKSDFLLLPEYFYASERVSGYQELPSFFTGAWDWLLRLSENYRGTVIGGSLIYTKGRKQYIGIPVLKKGMLVDWRNKQKLNAEEKKIAVSGNGEGIFILSGIRFAVAAYSDLQQKSYLKALSQEAVKIVFSMANFGPSRNNKKTSAQIVQHAQEFNMNIILCCAAGKSFLGPLLGCSLVATPEGISWQVSQQEESKELLKTIMLNYTL